MHKFLPLLASGITMQQLDELAYPLLGFYKYDGIRALRLSNGLVSRRLKPIPNRAVRAKFDRCVFFDGELISGPLSAPDVFNRTSSQVMTEDESAAGVAFVVFDHVQNLLLPYTERRKVLARQAKNRPNVIIAPMESLASAKEVLQFEQYAVTLGYEGIMLRRGDAVYKCGRSTVSEQIMLKLKRFEDGEATIVDIEPRMHNANEAERDERGYVKRSSKQEGKQTMAEVGKFVVRDLKTKKTFRCSTGVLTQKQRVALWRKKHELVGKVVKYRYQPAGGVELPRFPRFYGFRSRMDF